MTSGRTPLKGNTSLLTDYLGLLYETLSITARLVAALILGTIVGVERHYRQGMAGLTTHALVALGAAAYCALPDILDVSEDVRMGGQVVTGIGFLGAGLILRDGASIRGLSTSATVWATGAIGVLAGYGRVFEAAEATFLIVLINFISPKLRNMLDAYLPIQPVGLKFSIQLRIEQTEEAEMRARLLADIEESRVQFQSLERLPIPGTQQIRLVVDLQCRSEEEDTIASLVRQLSLSPNILSCSYSRA